MERVEKQSPRPKKKLLVIVLAVLFACLLLAVLSIVRQFMRLNDSVEHERTVFVSQLAEQMKKNLITNGENNLASTRGYAAILNEIAPESFAQVKDLFAEYAEDEAANRLFFLSTSCELYGIDGVKQWASLPYDEYFADVLTEEHTIDYIRIGMNQEFMAYSARLAAPVEIDGHEIAAVVYGWGSSKFRSTLSSTLFETKSSILLVGESGNIVAYPENVQGEAYGYNVFTYLAGQGMLQSDLDFIQELLHRPEDHTALYDVGGARWLLSIARYDEQYSIFVMLPIQITSADTYQNLYGLIAGVIASFLILAMIVGIIILAAVFRQRAQRERELQTEFLMKTAQTKNEFLAKMSHDIRTPLNGIIGMNHIASTQAPPECTELKASLGKVDTAANYLLGILNDILDMSKIESGELRLSAKPFSLPALRSEIESLMGFQMAGKALRFDVQAPETVACDYIGDELRIKQILINLLSNAVKFTDTGSITLKIEVQPIDEERDELCFVVQDTGKGMSKAFLAHAFDPFSQEDEGIAAKYGGSGLGLSIVKSFIDLMGGRIEITSELGMGSVFTVRLPMVRAERADPVGPAGQKAEPACCFSGQRVLLCEDNDLNAEIATVILRNYRLAVDRAENGQVGVELFRQSEPGHYSLIFMDVRMPQMDGYEATRAIRALERPDAREVPICALSANAFSEDIAQSLEAGMNEHLAKPLNISLLNALLIKYLGK